MPLYKYWQLVILPNLKFTVLGGKRPGTLRNKKGQIFNTHWQKVTTDTGKILHECPLKAGYGI